MKSTTTSELTSAQHRSVNALSAEEELRLIAAIQNEQGTQREQARARKKLVMANMNLVDYFISSKGLYLRNDVEDLRQEGICGILSAIENFDPTHKCRFSTFAKCYVRKYIYAYLDQYGSTVRHGFCDNNAEVAIKEDYRCNNKKMSFTTEDVDIQRFEYKSELEYVLGILTEKERRVYIAYHGLEGVQLNFTQMSKAWGEMSAERYRQVFHCAEDKIINFKSFRNAA